MFRRHKSKTVVKREIAPTNILFLFLFVFHLLLLLVLLLGFSSTSTTTTTTTTATKSTILVVVSAFSPIAVIPIKQHNKNRNRNRKRINQQQQQQQQQKRDLLSIAPVSSIIHSSSLSSLTSLSLATTAKTTMMTTMTTTTTASRNNCVGTNTTDTTYDDDDDDDKSASTNSISLLQKRLHDDYGIPISDTILIIDNDEDEDCEDNEEEVGVEEEEEEEEEKKDDKESPSSNKVYAKIVEIKTLVWEVQVMTTTTTTIKSATCDDDDENDDETTTTTTTKFHIVTALQMKDKVNISKLKQMIIMLNTSASESASESKSKMIHKIHSLQLAPLSVAESLTGYQSGCMPPICHSSNTNSNSNTNTNTNIIQLYLDESIIDIHQQYIQQKNNTTTDECCCFASIGSGIIGTSLRLPLYQFLRVAGVNNTAITGSFIVVSKCSTTATTTTTTAGMSATATITTTASESKMMSSIEVRKQEQQQMLLQKKLEIINNNNDDDNNDNNSNNYIGTVKKDRLKEYRSFDKDDIVSKSKLFRTTARKKGRIHEMKLLIDEALHCGGDNNNNDDDDDDDDNFPKLFQTNEHSPDNDNGENQNQNPRTRANIDKNALHICAWRGDYETVIHLVETSKKYYPTLDIVNIISKGSGNYGKTPIFFALTQCRDDVVKYFISDDVNANLLIVNNKGQTPCSIARSHMSDDTCQLLYEKEAEQLRKGNKFTNYRNSIHSDHKLYGDLDPRFPIDNNNRYNDDDNGHYNDNDNVDDDIADQIKEYHKSIAQAQQQPNDTTIIDGIPTQFTPRSLRPTVRWWNRNDHSLAAANYDGDGNDGSSGQITFTQSHRRANNNNNNKNPQRTTDNEEDNSLNEGVKMMMKPRRTAKLNEIDIESLDLISIDEILLSATAADEYPTKENVSSSSSSSISHYGNAILVDSFESLQLFEEEVEKCISETQQQEPLSNDDDVDVVVVNDGILVKYAWGIDCEWKPGPDCGMDSPVSTLQLSTSRKSFLIDVQTLIHSTITISGRVCDCDAEDFESMSSSKIEIDLDRILLKLFQNPNVSLVGYGVVQDLGKLSASFPHMKCFSEYVSVIDLQSISSVVYNNNKHDRGTMSSLQKMTATLLKKRLDKSQQVSDWSRRPLSQEQITYAMLDAAIIPLLLKAVVEQSAILGRYNNELFKAHKNLRSTIRYTPIKPCEEGFTYEVTYGSIKSTLGKNFARQTWPTIQQLTPPLPKLVPYHCPSSRDDSSSSTTKISKKERAHHKKIGGGISNIGGKRPKAIPLKTLSGNLDNLPMPGITLGFTKESCAFRVVGHELFKTIPDGTYIGFNRRAGVIETSNAYIIFCNFGGGKVFSEFSNNGRLLSFRVKQGTESGRSSETSLYNNVMSSSSITNRDGKMKKNILLFARESTRTKYTYCGSCNCTDVIILDSDSKSLVLELNNYDELIDQKSRISSTFENLVVCSRKAAV